MAHFKLLTACLLLVLVIMKFGTTEGGKPKPKKEIFECVAERPDETCSCSCEGKIISAVDAEPVEVKSGSAEDGEFKAKCTCTCEERDRACPESYKRCGKSPQCVREGDWCDGVFHCYNGADERTCIDATVPVISGCPPTQINQTEVRNSSSLLGISVNWTPPTATDNSGLVTLTSNHDPGSFFYPGQSTVIYTATDPSGNQQTCSFTVDRQPG